MEGARMLSRDTGEKTIVVFSALAIIAVVILEILSKLIH
jgi:hypothetical protein